MWKKMTSTPIAAETLAPPLSEDVPALPARPQTMRSFSLPPVLTASTVMPWPVTTASCPMVALFVMFAKLTPTAAATWVPSLPVARPVAFALSLLRFSALTLTSPVVPVTCAPAAMLALFVVTTQLRLIDAPTPTPPLFLSPPWESVWLLPASVPPWPPLPSLAVGRVPVLPVVFGLLSTWSCFFLSASLSVLSAPFAVASAFASLVVDVSADADGRALDVARDLGQGVHTEHDVQRDARADRRAAGSDDARPAWNIRRHVWP